jgi:hypothetical protein
MVGKSTRNQQAFAAFPDPIFKKPSITWFWQMMSQQGRKSIIRRANGTDTSIYA